MASSGSPPASEVRKDHNEGPDRKPNETPSSSTPAAPTLTRSSTTPNPSTTLSSASPRASREVSPIRPNPRANLSSAPKATRSRKGSLEFSPNRSNSTPISNLPSVPSAAAIQRALSVAGTTQVQPPTSPHALSETNKAQSGGREPGGATTHSGKQTPKLKAPLPANKDVLQRRVESAPATPSIVVERSTPTSATDLSEMVEKSAQRSGMKTPRGIIGGGPTLETVLETVQPVEPPTRGRNHQKDQERSEDRLEKADADAIEEHQGRPDALEKTDKLERNERPERIDEDPMEEALAQDTKSTTTGTGSDSSDQPQSKRTSIKDGTKGAANHSSKPQIVRSKRSFTQLLPSKAKVQEGSTKGMTVETETVSTVPQVALGAATGERTAPGRTEAAESLRLKPSNETIRPKKERKKVVRKAPSINAGNASSKADIFEQKVATAVDQTNSSDSEETFVYESNPPEPLSARPYRYHSRTPSATSVISQYDKYAGGTRPDGGHSVVGKKSMKFANNSFLVDAGDQGPVRIPGQTRLTSNPSQHHHIGRFGRQGNGHASLFDSDSPFPNASKPLRTPTTNVARLSSRPSSPRSPQMLRMAGTSKHTSDAHVYDLEGDGADDERTPLMSTVRSNRSRNSRRPLPGTLRQGYIVVDKDRHSCRRITTYTSIGTLLILLAAATVMVLLMCSKPLVQIYVKDIRNVLASEQELMLDLHVRATNPNLIAVQVSDLDVNIFAKSKHVRNNALGRDGTQRRPSSEPYGVTEHHDRSHRRHRPDPATDYVHALDGVDEGTDPIEDPENDSSTMLLGRIFEFDSPLIFEPSPLHHQSLSSVGEVRLAQPGNRTEEGGSERWERVLLHDFELIVRGVLRYSLPISSKTRSVSIGSSIVVHPTEDFFENGAMVTSKPKAHSQQDSGSNVELRPQRGATVTVRFSG